jgi:hypothetical protein
MKAQQHQAESQSQQAVNEWNVLQLGKTGGSAVQYLLFDQHSNDVIEHVARPKHWQLGHVDSKRLSVMFNKTHMSKSRAPRASKRTHPNTCSVFRLLPKRNSKNER